MVKTRLAVALPVGLALLLAGFAVASASALDGPDSTRHVYDWAGVLTLDQESGLEARATAIHQLGHPIVVVVRTKGGDYESTLADARRLMDDWDVQSAPDARDGIVVLLQLKPGDKRHGHYAVVAGKSLLQSRVPQYELNRIAREMRSLLRETRFAEALGVALNRMERDIREGSPPPPPPSPIEAGARAAARGGPLSPVSLLSLFAAGVGIWLARRWSPPSRTRLPASSTANPPSPPLAPALAGALAKGSVDDQNIAATILDLAKRGALAIEPEGKKKAQLHLLDPRRVSPGYERTLWDVLSQEADTAGVISSGRMDDVRSRWGVVQREIRDELVGRGWFDHDARARRFPLILLCVALSFLCSIALVIAVIARSPSLGFGVVVLAIAFFFAIATAARVTNTTESGDRAAAPWRGYRRHIEAAGKDPQTSLDLEVAVPYALAFGVGYALNKRLQAASKQGVLPSWLGPSQNGGWEGGFYPYWIAFHSSAAPTSSGGSGSGASAGSGGAGGSF